MGYAAKHANPKKTKKTAGGGKKKKDDAKISTGAWYRWAKTYEWDRRAKAYDARLDKAKLDTEIQVTKDLAAERIRRREQVDEAAWSMAEALLDKAREILALPVSPLSVRLADVVPVVQLADKLGRMSVGLPTDNTSQNQKMSGSVEVKQDLPEILAAPFRDVAARLALELMGSTHSQPEENI